MKPSRVGLLLLLLLVTLPTQSQRLSRLPNYDPDDSPQKNPEFTFARMKYNGGYGWRGGWATDYPKADYQFIQGLRGWVKSMLTIANEPVAVSLHDPNLYDYPFIYCVEPGRLELSEQDAAALREYLERGGFLLMDDFWGTYEWENVQYQLKVEQIQSHTVYSLANALSYRKNSYKKKRPFGRFSNKCCILF